MTTTLTYIIYHTVVIVYTFVPEMKMYQINMVYWGIVFPCVGAVILIFGFFSVSYIIHFLDFTCKCSW